MALDINNVIILKNNTRSPSIALNSLGTIVEVFKIEVLTVYNVAFIDTKGQAVAYITFNEHQISQFEK